ncbi:hypothetical protein [Streptomyces sedi]|uniref:Peptide zinc metalloprotease protein n=1 Tax=Streptomyces sedi TaxID=555059 RepID=A0A5C4VF10_9ACTN|nr:hypothetical protein [Streptomyces sedi]TNM33629.1 hypothetical protein FH715_04600 [Streptomyces sedi]
MPSTSETAPERPRLAEPVEATADGGQVYVRIGTPPSYLRLGARAWSIAQLLDGSRTVDEAAREAGCPPAHVRKVMAQLAANGLLEGTEAPRAHGGDVHRQSLFFLKSTWHDPRSLATAHRLLARWCPPRVVLPALVALLAAGVVVCALRWGDMLSGANDALSWSAAWQVWPAILLRAVVHELGHAFTCLSFGRSVAALGVGLYYFQPVAFTDVSDIWLLRARWRRVLVHLSGPLVDLAILVASGCLVLALSDGAARTFAAYLFLSTVVGIVATLNPLLRSDGYFVLTELLREDDLRERAMALLATTAPWRVRVRDRTTAVLVAYGALSFVYIVVILGVAANVASGFLLGSVLGLENAVPAPLAWTAGAAVAVALWLRMLRQARSGTLA